MGEEARSPGTVTVTADGEPSPPWPGLPSRFRLVRRLGSGGQAEVWLAHDGELDEDVAVKVFRPGLDDVARERLRREVRIGRTLVHPRLVRVYELLEAGDRLAIVQELVPGGSLAEKLRRGPLPFADVFRVADEVLDALAHLHAAGVLHRDVKPSNLLVRADGGVVLADFGLARPPGAGDLTRTALSVGTPGFMSPEQLRGDEPTAASDLYSLGATLFELTSARPPFEGNSAFEVARRHMSQPAPSLRKLRAECPEWFDRFVARLLEKRPGDRFPSAEAAREALAARRAPLGRRAVRRRLALSGVLALVVLCGIGLLGLAGRSAGRNGFALEVSGETVRALGADRRPLWERRFHDPVVEAKAVDVDGDGRDEVAVAAMPNPGGANGREAPSEVSLLDASGRERTRFAPERGFRENFPFGLLPSFHPHLDVLSFPAETPSRALFVRAQHRWLYPSQLVTYWAGPSRWERLLLHSGTIGHVIAVSGGPGRRIAFAGVNNQLALLFVVGVMDVTPPAAGGGESGRFVVVSGDGVSVSDRGVALRWYTLCGPPPPGAPALAAGADGGVVLGDRTPAYVLDRWGNPVPGPNAGRDLGSARLAFLRDLGLVYRRSAQRGVAATSAGAEAIRRDHGPLLAEAPYREALALGEGVGLARAGDGRAARDVLGRAVLETPTDDLVYRLAQLEALAGDLAGAERRLLSVVGRTGRTYDVQQLLLRVYVEAGNVERAQALAASLPGFGNDGATDRIATHMARAHLLRDAASEADTRARSWSYVPEADAFACLARWRLGRTLPSDPDAMSAAAKLSPEVATEFRVARAAALLGLGKVADADSDLERTIGSAEIDAREDFSLWQTLQLARGLRTRTLLALGEKEKATELAGRLAAASRPGLLSGILAAETLRDARRR